MNGWILLHKKLWESENFRPYKNRGTLILVWIWLLTHCNDKGVVTCGRNQIAEDTDIHPSSVKRALEHFRDKMGVEVTYEATKVYTKITIKNWSKYQRKATKEVTYKRPTSDLQVTTNKEERIKNKENNTKVLGDYGNPQVNEVVKCFEDSFGFTLTRKQLNRQAAYRLVKKYGLEKVLGAIKAAYEVQEDRYAPGISNLLDLEEKLPRLAKYYTTRTSVNLDKQGVQI